MKTKILLGKTTDNTLVFANIENTTYFSVSFDEVAPVIATEEYLKERIESSLDCYSKEELYDMCESYDCRPSELAEELSIPPIYVEDIIDTSLYPETYNVDGIDDDIYFESVSCGQIDTRDRLIPIYKDTSDDIFYVWEKYHLKHIDNDTLGIIISRLNDYKTYALPSEEKWIQNFLNILYKENK